jgi:hypothetical protein
VYTTNTTTETLLTYTTRKGTKAHILSYTNAAQGSRGPACGQSRSIHGGGYMLFVAVGTPTCPHCLEIAKARIAETGTAERLA